MKLKVFITESLTYFGVYSLPSYVSVAGVESFDDKVYGEGDKSWMDVGDCGGGLSKKERFLAMIRDLPACFFLFFFYYKSLLIGTVRVFVTSL